MTLRRPAVALLAATLTACGGGAAGSADLDPGCFTISQAVQTLNDAQDSTRAGTATAGDTAKAYTSVVDKLNEATTILPAGQVHDLAATAALSMGKARVAQSMGAEDAQDIADAITALTTAAPLCKGHTP